MYQNYKNAFTHAGLFHADDVFSTALLRYLFPDIQVSRGFNVPENFDGIVYDIGLGKYDHHQTNRRVRENGIPYAAFGLLWEEFGSSIVGEKEATKFDEEFVQPLDLADNTGKRNLLSQIIADRNPHWKETEISGNVRFEEAVSFAKEILEYRFSQILAEKEAYDRVQECARNVKEKIMYLEKVMPWREAIKGFDCEYVIYPSLRGGYNVQAVPLDDGDGMQLKRPFPKEWRGCSAKQLQELTGIAGITFCHMSGFLCASDTLEDAYKVAKMAMKSDFFNSIGFGEE